MVWWFGSGFPSQKTGVQIPNPPIQTTNSGQPDTRHPNKAPSPKNDEHTSDPLTHPLLGGTHPNKCTWKLTKEISSQASKQALHTYSLLSFHFRSVCWPESSPHAVRNLPRSITRPRLCDRLCSLLFHCSFGHSFFRLAYRAPKSHSIVKNV